MKILSIDCSAVSASVAILEDEKIVSSCTTNVGLTHSQTLMPMVQSALSQSQVSLDEVDRFAISAGPGSFTGVRIGVAALKGLTAMTRENCFPVSTLEAMAYNYAGVKDAVICSTMDARCGQVYTALFAVVGNRVARLCEDSAILISDLPEFINKALGNLPEEFIDNVNLLKNDIIFIGDGARLCYNVLENVVENCHIAPTHLLYQNAMGVALCALAKIADGEAPIDSENLLPIYLRAPQAERELKKKQEALK